MLNKTKILLISAMAMAVLSSDASAQLFRGGLVRRVFGRNQEEESQQDKDDQDAPKDKNSQKKSDKPSSRPHKPSSADVSVQAFGMELTQSRRDGAVLVAKVTQDGDAAASGIQRGDHLVSLAGIRIDNLLMLTELEKSLSSGDRIEAEFVRKGKTDRVQIAFDHGADSAWEQDSQEQGLTLSATAESAAQDEPLQLTAPNAPEEVESIELPRTTVVAANLAAGQGGGESLSNSNIELAELLQLLRQQQRVIEAQSREIRQLRDRIRPDAASEPTQPPRRTEF